jgi:FMN-dependent NADH-azoreductase
MNALSKIWWHCVLTADVLRITPLTTSIPTQLKGWIDRIAQVAVPSAHRKGPVIRQAARR